MSTQQYEGYTHVGMAPYAGYLFNVYRCERTGKEYLHYQGTFRPIVRNQPQAQFLLEGPKTGRQKHPSSGLMPLVGAALALSILAGILLSMSHPHQIQAQSPASLKKQTITIVNPKVALSQQAIVSARSADCPQTGTCVVGKPTISATFLQTILCENDSPACGESESLYNLGVQYHIDPVFPLAFFFNESNFGKAGMATTTKSIGNLRCIDGAACVNSEGGNCQAGQSCYASFPTWTAGFAAWYALIAGPIYIGAGKLTVETIIPTYAPSGDNNVPTHYIWTVDTAISTWRTGSPVLP